ncbi:MAG: HAD hydrolase-like protein [Balneolaceae bacterium]|nr:HAD hydrolase-like protein [Balneolaceae bacterium]MCH8549323.1 HAD hydrolase-like protein [Balneolaceae bacterium]
MKPILLFDIDGTLLQIKRPFLHDVIEQILSELNVSRDRIKNRSFAGRTDRDIFGELADEHPDPETFSELKRLYIEIMEKELSSDQLDLIPGADEAVHHAVNNGYSVGLCTGNFREVAFRKVDAAGFGGVFRFGGFGCNHADRKFLPGEADLDYRRVFKNEPTPEQYVVIGDTPNDIRCAKHFGARSLAVTTGGFSSSELKKHSPDLVRNGLSNPLEWLEQL